MINKDKLDDNGMKTVKKHFDAEATEYDELIRTLIPNYDDMIDILVSSIPFDEGMPIKVLDLGCGTGNISQRVKERFPKSHIKCVDLAENMIKMAKNKLSQYPNISYEIADFQHIKTENEYDLVISALALHHLETDGDKLNFYHVLYRALKSGGAFFNADVVLASSDYMQEIYINKWIEFLSQSYSKEKVENEWLRRYYEEDRPASMMKHMKWLEEAGFKQVDIVWKYYNYVVYGGVK